MTIITTICSDAGVLIGYNDGSELDGTPIRGTSRPWIFFKDWALGITGESSVQRLLQYELKNYSGADDDPEDLVNTIKDCLVANEVGSKSESEYVVTFGIYGILAHKDGRVWDLSGCLSLTEIPKGSMWARGSGADYAIGAYHALNRMTVEISEADKLLICVEAAIENDVHSIGGAVTFWLSK